MRPLRHVAIVVPACNEEGRIAACIRSIRLSARLLRREYPCVSYDIVVVLDSCTDQTGTVVARCGGRTIASTAGRVGTARHAGAVDAVTRARRAGIPDELVWLANTDADTTVPHTWLTTQLEFANAGLDAVIGTVTPDGLDSAVEGIWRKRHHLTEGHDHVHGANLGVRASSYLQAGGFASVSLHEDLDLVNRVKARTPCWVATHRTTVKTSARIQSRIDGGFASYVADLGPESVHDS